MAIGMSAAASSQLCVVLLCVIPCLASLHLFAENSQLTTYQKGVIKDALGDLLATIHPDLSYYAGSAFRRFPSEDDISITLLFHPRSQCGRTLNSTWVRSATGKDLQAGFNATLKELDELMERSYGTGYVLYGQFLVGYVSGEQPYGCVSLKNATVEDGVGYCYGFDSMLLSGSPFDTLYAGCMIESPDKRFVLRMDNCQLSVMETTTNNTDWNLVLYNSTVGTSEFAKWSSATFTKIKTGAVWLEVGPDGVLTIYLGTGPGGAQSIWKSKTDSHRDFDDIYGPPGPPVESPTNAVLQAPVPNAKPTNKFKVLSIVIMTALTFGLTSLLIVVIWQSRRLGFYKNEPNAFASSKLQRYTFSTLLAATKNFHAANKLGEGGSAVVYKGIIQTIGPVAIKFLQIKAHSISNEEFINEVSTISYLQHKNLIRLVGFCCEGEHRLLVYEFLENNSLALAILSGPNKLYIPWAKRYEICLGVARGIAYLHEESRTRIVHRDIKASNILLDKEFNARVSDFGLARLLKDGDTHLSTRVAGTFGYLAPEYALRGKLTEKADVYSFGILLLEILSGRSSIDFELPPEKSFLLEWAWELYEEGQWLDLVDEKLPPETCPKEELQRVMTVSLICTQGAPSARPAMSRVVAMLLGDIAPTLDITRPGFLPDLKHAALSKVTS
ncbi:probable LRR receptor-like serine/threonine-protein kinase At1g56140 isoform X2 [Selaginella moellendorffii]|uniref:probable LRR receptor-like serine/threonine-protein kinase At1g56140 isoform X2 n=1 Tax=Selaginella moellendorffii TaxID=88036 RepID=UPI000D1C43DD|nr:probable LRR receptor-like serine/threonine-protein kinase At1g56140 isoform X2 [Selaginella moellendorffii]|eukprot:XP_024525950.1 probable LRR receptor-like serine/threonine-protein kinase At1g56140 isoform X2 [Selaginella moellendorffii]